ncbi:MAG: carbon-nitrogen hydrolase family protein [Eubacteriales bacterium]|nr:carbon-nitrogen hydrolase family protein [Eubacteriales bacterium]
MKIGLLQTKQNELYDFTRPETMRTEKEILKYQKEMIDKNLQLARKAAGQGAQVLVTSEAVNYAGRPKQYRGNYNTLIRQTQNELLEAFSRIAEEFKAYIVLGMFLADAEDELYNCALLLEPHGSMKACYKKTHLAGEEKEYLKAGNDLPIVETEYGKFGFAVCWDMQFPETARILAIKGADIVFCPTWGWEWIYGPARAYENGIYVAAAMGVPYWMDIEGLRSPSQIIAPDGSILVCGNISDDEAVVGEADIRTAKVYRKARLDDRRQELYRKIRNTV